MSYVIPIGPYHPALEEPVLARESMTDCGTSTMASRSVQFSSTRIAVTTLVRDAGGVRLWMFLSKMIVSSSRLCRRMMSERGSNSSIRELYAPLTAINGRQAVTTIRQMQKNLHFFMDKTPPMLYDKGRVFVRR